MANDVKSKVILGMDVKEFRRGITQVDSSMKRVSRQFQNLGSLIGATFAASVLLDFSKEAIRLNSQLEKAAAGFARFGTEGDLNEMRKSTMGLVTDLELMQQSVKGANLGIPLQQMGTLLAFAKRRADETGESIDYLVNSIVEGIGRKSTRRLDNLGITAERLHEAMKGVSMETASVKEVSDAFTSIAKEELDKMGNSAETAADKLDKLNVAWQNFKARTGGFLADVGTVALGAVTFGGDIQRAQAEERLQRQEALKKYGSLGNTGAVLKIKPQGATNQNVVAVQKEIVSLDSLGKKLQEVTADFNAAAVGSAEFYKFRNEAQALEQQIKDLTDGVVPQTEALKVNAKTTTDVYQAQEKSLRIMRQLPDAGLKYKESLEGIQIALEEYNRQSEALAVLGGELGVIFSTAFSAAINDGEDFFQKMREGLKAYIQQMLAATAATLALAAAMAIIFPKIGFNAAFNILGGGMGLPFGFGDNGQMGLRISGNDFYTGMERNNTRNSRTGG